MISDMVLKNLEGDINNMPQPHALSTGIISSNLQGGKRVRKHPQQGNTAYSADPQTLLSSDNLMFDHGIYGANNHGISGSGMGNDNPYSSNLCEEMGGSFFDDIGHGLKNIGSQVMNDVVMPVGKEVGKDMLKSYLSGSGTTKGQPRKTARKAYEPTGGKRGRPKKGGDFLGSLGNIGKQAFNDVIMPVGKEVGKDMLKSYLTGKGKRGRPKKEGGDIGKDILSGLKEIAPIALPLMMGLGKKPRGRPTKGGSAELYPPVAGGKRGCKKGGSARGEMIKKVMKEHGLNLANASKFIKQHNLY